MIRLSNGFEFEYSIASGAIKFGKGWLIDFLFAKIKLLYFSVIDVAVTKTLTRHPKKRQILLVSTTEINSFY